VDNGEFTMPAISSTLLSYNNFRELFGMERIGLYDEQAANVLVSRDPGTDITLEYTGNFHGFYYLYTFPYRLLYSLQFRIISNSSLSYIYCSLLITKTLLRCNPTIVGAAFFIDRLHRHERVHLRQTSRCRPRYLPSKLPEQLHTSSET